MLYFDVLNVVASFGVVAMHFNGLVHAYSPSAEWRQALFVDCIFYWAVPVFFMLTGATLMDYRTRYDTQTFFKKRIARTFGPFLAWSLFAYAWKIATGQMEAVGPRTLVTLVLNTKIIDIYWFFLPLFGVYLCMPLLSKLKDDRKVLLYGLGMAFALNIAAPPCAQAVGIQWNDSLGMPVLGGYLVYVVAGYLLRDAQLTRRQRVIVHLLGALGVVTRYAHTVSASNAAGELVNTTWGYLNLPCFMESMAVYCLVREVKWDRIFSTQNSRKLLARVASCSFGVYLTHMIVFWYGLQITGLQGKDLAWRTAGPVVAYLICLAITLAAKRVPVIRKMFP